MSLVTDYVLPEGAVFCYARKHSAPTSIRFADGTNIPYKIYTVWRDMMRRVVWKSSFQKCDTKYYGDCEVADFFQDYFNFYEWSKKQFGFNKLDINGKIFTIDKDILSTDRGYFPENVVFVPRVINNFFYKNRNCSFMRGVAKPRKEKKYTAQISTHNIIKIIGRFDTELEAHIAYCKAKNAYGQELAQMYKDHIDPRVYERLMNFDAQKEFS